MAKKKDRGGGGGGFPPPGGGLPLGVNVVQLDTTEMIAQRLPELMHCLADSAEQLQEFLSPTPVGEEPHPLRVRAEALAQELRANAVMEVDDQDLPRLFAMAGG